MNGIPQGKTALFLISFRSCTFLRGQPRGSGVRVGAGRSDLPELHRDRLTWRSSAAGSRPWPPS
jgi:hypothetical protein